MVLQEEYILLFAKLKWIFHPCSQALVLVSWQVTKCRFTVDSTVSLHQRTVKRDQESQERVWKMRVRVKKAEHEWRWEEGRDPVTTVRIGTWEAWHRSLNEVFNQWKECPLGEVNTLPPFTVKFFNTLFHWCELSLRETKRTQDG